MTLDGGWGTIIATIIGVFLTAIGAVVWAHFARVQRDMDKISDDVARVATQTQEGQIELLEFKAYAEKAYVSAWDFKDFTKAIFAKLDAISDKMDTKADK